MIRKLLFALLMLFTSLTIKAQKIIFNPQAGLYVTSIAIDENPVIKSVGKAGFQIGFDARIGDRLYLQPGLFYTQSETEFKFKDNLGGEIVEGYTRSGLKLKAMGGFKLIDTNPLALRIALGPTYDFNLNTNGNSVILKEDDFNNGTLNFDAAVGLDVSILSFDLGYSYGFTEAFDDNNLNLNPKYQSFYVSIGILIGK